MDQRLPQAEKNQSAWAVGGISGQPGSCVLGHNFPPHPPRFTMREGTLVERLGSKVRLPGKLPNLFVPQFPHPKGLL